MIRELGVIFIIFLAAIFQTSFLVNFFSREAVPDIVLVLAISWLVQRNLEKKWYRMFWAGFFLDVLEKGFIGLNAFSFVFVALTLYFISERFFPDLKNDNFSDFLILASFVTAGTLLSNLIVEIGLWGLKDSLFVFSGIFGLEKLTVKIIWNLVFLGIFYWPVKKLDTILYLRRKVLLGRE